MMNSDVKWVGSRQGVVSQEDDSSANSEEHVKDHNMNDNNNHIERIISLT